jgi:flagellar basal body rod protein FlgG
MNYGMYLAGAGVLTNLYRQDVMANNLANVNTVGFKPDMVLNRARLPERLESGADVNPQLLLEQLGGGALVNPTYISQSQGALKATGNPLDVAIDGEGYFVVAGDKNDGAGSFRLTRDGRFTLNSGGELVMAATGRRVLDVNGRAIELDPAAPVEINADGTITQNGAVAAQLQIVAPADPRSLEKAGDNLLRVAGDDRGLLQPATGQIRQGHLEDSAVDPILALNELISATKAAQASAQMMQYHDQIAGQAIGTFGRVA